MEHKGTKVLETERLVLRKFTMEDAQPMFDAWASDPEVTKYLTWPAHESVAISEMVMKDWVAGYEKPDHYKWAITWKETGKLMGDISAVQVWDHVCAAEIGYCMSRKWWGQGVMTEALKAVVDYLIVEVGMNKVGARHDPRNIGSGKVMQKAGMTYEGTLRQCDRNNQGICDAAHYSILKEEWERTVSADNAF